MGEGRAGAPRMKESKEMIKKRTPTASVAFRPWTLSGPVSSSLATPVSPAASITPSRLPPLLRVSGGGASSAVKLVSRLSNTAARVCATTALRCSLQAPCCASYHSPMAVQSTTNKGNAHRAYAPPHPSATTARSKCDVSQQYDHQSQQQQRRCHDVQMYADQVSNESGWCQNDETLKVYASEQSTTTLVEHFVLHCNEV